MSTWTFSSHRSCNDTRLTSFRIPTCVLVVVNVLILFCLLPISVVLWNHQDKIQMGRQSNGQVTWNRYCFKEGEMSCLERGYELKAEGDVCCGNLQTHLYHLTSEVLQERLQTDAVKDGKLKKIKGYIKQVYADPSSLKVRPAAHLGIATNGNATGPDSGAPRIHWEKSGESSFLSGDMVHAGDRVRVKTPGYYYVYTGLQYNVDPSTVDTGAIVAYIYRHVNGTRASRRKLMMARESSCKTTRGNVTGPVSVYMAGIFLLRDQDEISVRTHSLSLLNRSPATTYMGLHMV